DLGPPLGDALYDHRVHADLATAEGLTGELEQHPVVPVAVGRVECGGGGQRRGGVGQRVIPRSKSKQSQCWAESCRMGRTCPTRTSERPRSRDGNGAERMNAEPQAWPTSKRANRSTVMPASSTICFTVRLGSVID